MTTRAIIATYVRTYVRTHAWRNLSLTRTTAYRYRSTEAHRVRGFLRAWCASVLHFFMIERSVSF